jgi:hypothetical protein
MGGRVLTLDTVLSSSHFFAGKWSPALKRNQSRDLLRHLLCRLYGASKGNLFRARIRASHASLAAELGLSREWVCKLSGRLQETKWLDYYAPRLSDGTFEVGIFRPGRMLKRLLCMLSGSRRSQHHVNKFSQSFPLLKKEREKRLLQALRREKEPPKPELLAKIPLLRTWLGRGEGLSTHSQ